MASPAPSQWLRWLLVLAIAVLAVLLLVTVIGATERLLALWELLRSYPAALRWAIVTVVAVLIGATGWLVLRLLFPSPVRAPRASPIDRTAVEQRIKTLEVIAPRAATDLHDALAEFDRRADSQTVHVAMFGEVSAGKSSLIRALTGADVEVGVLAGTTVRPQLHDGHLTDGTPLKLADVPGSGDQQGHLALARAEAAQAHALLFVVDGDLTRQEDEELRQLARFGRPILLLLNKSDRFDEAEVEALLQRFDARYRELGIRAISVSAGHKELIRREQPNGETDQIERTAPPQIAELERALQAIASVGSAALEPGRRDATLAAVDERLGIAEQALQRDRAEGIVRTYTRRAVIGAMAAVAPGTDLVIQTALGAAMTRALATNFGLKVRDVDVDALLKRASSVARTGTAVTLAIGGNALKAFPGLGTLGGGLVHAVAYGLIFDSLGRALTMTLAETRALDRDASLQAFERTLKAPRPEHLRAIVTIAADALRRPTHDDKS